MLSTHTHGVTLADGPRDLPRSIGLLSEVACYSIAAPDFTLSLPLAKCLRRRPPSEPGRTPFGNRRRKFRSCARVSREITPPGSRPTRLLPFALAGPLLRWPGRCRLAVTMPGPDKGASDLCPTRMRARLSALALAPYRTRNLDRRRC